ncbi:SARP family transcriptional regulator, partial [Nonomuraea sp. NN258]|uniref:AfsR/SARP family transcriptional regulator n=1 Tax=Nonomuraea antri TaxID=2730852 RepID=UPI001567F970
MLTFHVLGPLEVRSAGRPLRISGRKPRLLLATLLLDAGRVVGADRLAEVLWPDRPPRSAQANLRTYVSSLRTDLGSGLLRGDGAGYAIDVPDDALDLLAFESLAARARYAEALALWRGAPLCDLPGSPLWDRRVEALQEVRLRAAEALIGQRIEHGDQAGAIAGLRALLAEQPYREDLWCGLLLALHRCGRKAEALRTYAAVRERLVDELGVEPGAELREVHETLLADDPPLPHPAKTAAHGKRPGEQRPGEHRLGEQPQPRQLPPRQLPPDLPDFVGQAEALAALAEPFSVAVISGAPGTGKTALAVHAAHALRERYPAGQLHLELDGRDPADLLAEALRALGARPVPATVGERSALLRTLLAERPMLMLLDDADDAAQVRPLLPGNRSAVIVTSRRRITELPGALRIDLGELTTGEALRLLAAIAGAERVAREREAALAIVAACGGLPLAVRNAGTRLAARPGWSLSVLARRLEEDWLGELKDVRASLDRGYLRLSGEAARTLVTLGLLGGAAQPGWVVDAALGRDRADDVTDLLVDVNLLDLAGTDPVGQPRYRVPDLIRRHALERGPTLTP